MMELAADRSNVVATAKSDWTATGQISVLFLFFYKQGPFKKIDVGLARLSHFHPDKLKARDRSPTRSMFTPRLSHIQNSSAVNERQHEPNETAAEAAGTTPLLSSPLLPRKRGE